MKLKFRFISFKFKGYAFYKLLYKILCMCLYFFHIFSYIFFLLFYALFLFCVRCMALKRSLPYVTFLYTLPLFMYEWTCLTPTAMVCKQTLAFAKSFCKHSLPLVFFSLLILLDLGVIAALRHKCFIKGGVPFEQKIVAVVKPLALCIFLFSSNPRNLPVGVVTRNNRERKMAQNPEWTFKKASSINTAFHDAWDSS